MGYVQDIRQKIGHDRLMIVGAGVPVHKDGKLLLQRRADDGTWADHGGCVEIGESVEDAARRELREETGLIAGELTLLGVFSGEDMLHTYPNGDLAAIVSVLFLCEDFTGELCPQTEEVRDLQWFPLDALPVPFAPTDQPGLNACLKYLKDRKERERASDCV